MTQMQRTADREGCGRRSVTVCYEHDRNGNVARILLPSQAEILREYDAADRLIKETHRDSAGGIHNITSFSYDKAGNLVSIRDHQGRETRMEYDGMNREICRTEKDGAVTKRFCAGETKEIEKGMDIKVNDLNELF